MNRRQLLAAAGMGTATLLAGCNGDGNGHGDGNGSDEPLDGQWELQARVVNEDDQPREWRVECRSADRGSVASAFATVPAGGEAELVLSGQLFDEEREVYAESDNGAIGMPWLPTECRTLSAVVTISGGEPAIDEECVEE